MSSLAKTSTETLTVREKLFYGFGDFGSCLFWNSFQMNLVFYYTDVFGLAAAALTPLFLFTRIFDGVTDVIVGSIADRTKTRWGRYRPFILWFSLPLCLSGVLMFTTPDFGYTGKILWAWITYNVVMLMYTLVNIPYTALLGTISPDANERASVSTFKFGCAFTANIVVSWYFMPWTKEFANGNPQHGWQMAFLAIAALALPFFLLSFLGTKERVLPIAAQKSTLRQDLKDLIGNRVWALLLAITLSFVFFNAARSTVMNHYLKYVAIGANGTVNVDLPILGQQVWDFETLQSRFNTFGQFASVIGVFIIGLFVKKMEKKWNLIMWWIIASAATAWPYFLRPEQVEWLIYTNILGSVASAPICVLIWAMYSDAAEFSEWKNNRQAAGLVFSASTFSQKVGWGIGPAIVTYFMSSVGFVANQAQTAEVNRFFLLFISLVPAVFGLFSAALVFFYPLKDKQVHEMSAELKLRREKTSNAPA